jgi:hypothetical protein
LAHDKYHCSPCQKLDWLGYTWDTVNGLIFFKEERIQNLEKEQLKNPNFAIDHSPLDCFKP